MSDFNFAYQRIRLIGVTQPNTDAFREAYDRTMSPEDLISYCARVSNPSNQTNFQTSGKLLKYLMEHAHWSPFEMVHVVMEVITTRDIGRQLLRHRSYSFQEFSQRYAEAQSFTHRETRMQDHTNRQKSIPCTDEELDQEWHVRQHQIMLLAHEHYEWALKKGIAKEQARCILPEGMTLSTMYVSGTLRSWIHYIDLRQKEAETQLEHVDLALKAKAILMNEFPFLKEHWE